MDSVEAHFACCSLEVLTEHDSLLAASSWLLGQVFTTHDFHKMDVPPLVGVS